MDANKVTICWPNRTDQGTLSGGSWNSAFPLTNLQHPVFKRKARSVNLASLLFNLALPSFKNISVVALAAHNMTTSATWRVRVYADVAQTELLHDSGDVFVWPSVYTQDQLEWEFDNFWTGTPAEDELGLFTPLAVHFLPDTVIARSVRVDIADASNPATYIEIGRLFVSEAWQPSVNMSFGSEYGNRDETQMDRALDGTKYWDQKTPERFFKCALNFLPPEEAFNRILLMQRTLGKSGELLVAPNLLLNPQFGLKTFIATLGDMSPVAHPYLDIYSHEFLLEEKL